MNITYFDRKAGRNHAQLTQSGDSDAIHVLFDYRVMTVMLSAIAGGSAKVQYSLSTQEQVEDDTAAWHDWSAGSVSTDRGVSFDSPISYIKVVAAPAVSYKLEALI